MTHRATVLFVCVHNAGRSQIAAALLNHYRMGRIDVRSAGSTPGDRINPAAALVLEEWGMDLFDAQQASQSSMFARPETRLIDVCDS